MIDLPESARAWFAGFFDGEGCIIIERRKGHGPGCSPRYLLRVAVANTYYDAIEEYKKYFGGHIEVKQNMATRPVYFWVANSKIARRFLESIISDLKVKKKQAELGISFQKTVKHHGGSLHKPLIELHECERIRQEMKRLNKGASDIRVILPKREGVQGILIGGEPEESIPSGE